MGTRRTNTNTVRTAWDAILGTKSHVRILRVLEQTRESMAVRELARRAGEHLRAVQLAVERLVQAGVVERVGTGAQQHVRINEQHPLTPALQQLFEAERARFERLVSRLKLLAKECAREATAVWLRDGAFEDDSSMELGLLARSDKVDTLTDAFREAVADLMRTEDVSIEVRGWTEPDLEATEPRVLPGAGPPVLLRGNLPMKPAGAAPLGAGPRSHAAVDDALRDRAARVAAGLERRPELVRKARDEVRNRLTSAPPPEARTLREWQQVLDGMSVPRLRRWLVGRTERATRLRQSMPLALLEAAEQKGTSRRSKP